MTMFVLTPVSALPPYTYHFHPCLARQRAEQRAQHRQEELRKQLILDALRVHEHDNSPFYDYGYDYDYGYNPVCPAFDPRQVVLERAAREREAHYEKLKRLAALRAQHEAHARRRANAERFLTTLRNRTQSEISSQPVASTSKAPLHDAPSFKRSLEERLMTEYETMCDTLPSFLPPVSGVNSSEVPTERIPTVSTSANHAISISEQETEIITSEGKGKGKDLPQLDSEDDPSPAQVSLSLSEISAIASRLETLLANFQFPAELDFSPERSPSPSYSTLDTGDEFVLTYTSVNAPLRAHEHALSVLLSELDTIPSFGSHVVKDARRAVVTRVEQALEELEKCVEERRGRARARKAEPVTVVESVQVHDIQNPLANAQPVEENTDPMNVGIDASPLEAGAGSTDPSPDSRGILNNVLESVNAPVMETSAEGSVEVFAESAPMELYDITERDSSQTAIEAPSSTSFSIGPSNASITEPRVVSSTSSSLPASLPFVPSVLEIIQASALQDELSMESENANFPSPEKAVDEDMVVIEPIEEDVHSATQMENEPPSCILHREVDLNTSDSLKKISVPIPVSNSASVALTHSVPVSPSEVTNPTDSTTEPFVYFSPSGEQDLDTFLHVPCPVSPCLVPRNSEDEDGVVVGYEHGSEHENENEWSDIEA